ncbi:hypothetical protein N0V83_004165 [Neocucurbitaria cava]|uniref:DUF6594 domain-containing protein n=1 Tax=Neocucurbitaria cava TaxID=798079 RepID=A0A9W8YD69_9PLEO|nr:hypothetical protein N0V83_004165 [Neocucurbitaria cava]
MAPDAIKASGGMTLSPSPKQLFMDAYRINGRFGEGSMRAPNGELASIYGRKGEPVPPNLGTLYRPESEPLEDFIVDRLMNPFLKYVGEPFKSLWVKLSMYRDGDSTMEVGFWDVDARIISAIARAIVCVIAILSLAAPIATLNVIKETKLRIVVMTLFGQLFAMLAQFLGSGSLEYYILITA